MLTDRAQYLANRAVIRDISMTTEGTCLCRAHSQQDGASDRLISLVMPMATVKSIVVRAGEEMYRLEYRGHGQQDSRQQADYITQFKRTPKRIQSIIHNRHNKRDIELRQ